MAYLYMLTSPSNKQYVGIAKNVSKRWGVHKCEATTGNSSFAVHKAIRKYGFDSFKKEVLLIADYEYVKDMEKKVIKAFGTKSPHGYNLTDGGDGTTGRVWTESQRMHLAEVTRLRMADPLQREAIRKANLGKKYSPEVNQKKARYGRTHLLGRVVTDETKQKISAALIGNQYTKGRKLSEEHKAKVSTAMKGRVISEETKQRMRAAQIGKTYSLEIRQKMSLAAIAREAKRRALNIQHHLNKQKSIQNEL